MCFGKGKWHSYPAETAFIVVHNVTKSMPPLGPLCCVPDFKNSLFLSTWHLHLPRVSVTVNLFTQSERIVDTYILTSHDSTVITDYVTKISDEICKFFYTDENQAEVTSWRYILLRVKDFKPFVPNGLCLFCKKINQQIFYKMHTYLWEV